MKITILLMFLVIATFLSSCDIQDPYSFKRDSKLKVDPMDLTTTKDPPLDFYDSWDDLEYEVFESKIVDPRDIVRN